MNTETARALNRLNRRFYTERADAFSERRDHAWPGMNRVLDALPAAPATTLDIGCGNGRFGAVLGARAPDAHYLGFDVSAPLLATARTRADLPRHHGFVRGDFVEAPDALPRGPFALVAAFGVLHHVPGRARRAAFLDALARRLAPGGCLAFSAWRFGRFERFERLRAPAPATLSSTWEDGDALLSFEGDPSVPRYCHAIDDAELDGIALEPSGSWIDRFDADGREAALNTYRIWRRA